jgi:hypothetical protein
LIKSAFVLLIQPYLKSTHSPVLQVYLLKKHLLRVSSTSVPAGSVDPHMALTAPVSHIWVPMGRTLGFVFFRRKNLSEGERKDWRRHLWVSDESKKIWLLVMPL